MELDRPVVAVQPVQDPLHERIAGEQPVTKQPSQPQCFHVYKGRILVLTVCNETGTLHSTASPPADAAPVDRGHPFLDAQAHDAASEHDLRQLLLAANSFEDYLRRLLNDGFDISASEVFHLGPGYRLTWEEQLVGAIWQGQGLFACLWWSPKRQGPLVAHSVLTAYDVSHAAILHKLAAAESNDHANLIARLEEAGYRLVPLGR